MASNTQELSLDEATSKKETILNILNRQHGDFFYDLKAFGDGSNWNGVPIVYAEDHPDPFLFRDNPEEALKRINGRIVGKVKNSYVIKPEDKKGKPRLMGVLDIQDKELLDKYLSGELSPSTAFINNSDWDIIDGEVVRRLKEILPNHVLIFKEDLIRKPRDMGAMTVNMGEDPMSDTKVSKLQLFFKKLEALVKEFPVEEDIAINQEEKPMSEEISKLSSENAALMKEKTELLGQFDGLKNEMASRDAKIKELETTIATYKVAEEEAKKKEMEAKWEKVKASLPVGKIHTPEEEANLKKLFIENPMDFAVNMAEIKTKKVPTEAEGMAYAENNTKGEENIHVGIYDPATKGWKPLSKVM